jgi:hypothetical protein
VPGGRGGLGLGTIVILGLIGYALGIDPRVLIGGAEMMAGRGGGQVTQGTAPAGPPKDEAGRFVSAVLAQTEDVWTQVFRERLNAQYQKPRLVLFEGGTSSACGAAQRATGPFYCPLDSTVYLDLGFFADMQRQFGTRFDDFSIAYVIAHEIGHHVQHVVGTLDKARSLQSQVGQREGNQVQVAVELQADCYAGVWAHNAEQRFRILEQGDVEEAMRAAAAVGDDRIQKQTQGYVVPDSFTHGSSKQRVDWFMTGLKSGDPRVCNTFTGR